MSGLHWEDVLLIAGMLFVIGCLVYVGVVGV